MEKQCVVDLNSLSWVNFNTLFHFSFDQFLTISFAFQCGVWAIFRHEFGAVE